MLTNTVKLDFFPTLFKKIFANMRGVSSLFCLAVFLKNYGKIAVFDVF